MEEEVYDSFDEMPLDEVPPEGSDGNDLLLDYVEPPNALGRLKARITGKPVYKVEEDG